MPPSGLLVSSNCISAELHLDWEYFQRIANSGEILRTASKPRDHSVNPTTFFLIFQIMMLFNNRGTDSWVEGQNESISDQEAAVSSLFLRLLISSPYLWDWNHSNRVLDLCTSDIFHPSPLCLRPPLWPFLDPLPDDSRPVNQKNIMNFFRVRQIS